MDNVVHLKPITDADIEKAISVLSTIDVCALPDNVQAAIQQLALDLLRATV